VPVNWLTTKLLSYVIAGLLVALLGVSTYAYTQHQVAERRQSEAALANGKLTEALGANQISTEQIKRLEAERDSYLLKRAVEKAEADRLVEDSRNVVKRIAQDLQAARKRIEALSLSANCYAVMQAPICPAIADELRAP
jgi:hypothetical protein